MSHLKTKPNIRTVAGPMGYDAATNTYESEWYGRGIVPELARAIRTYKVTPAEYTSLCNTYGYSTADQAHIVGELLRWCPKGMGPHYRMTGQYDRDSNRYVCQFCGAVVA